MYPGAHAALTPDRPPINRHLAPAEVAYIVEDSDASVLFASAGLRELTGLVAAEVPGLVQGYAFGGDIPGCESYDDLLDSAGPPLPDQPRGSQIGTVCFERDMVPFVYHNDPDKTADSRHPDHENWSTVGDLGYLDEDGYLFLTDRKPFMIISGAVNIYPQEIENVLTLHPQIFDVAVIGVPDSEMGEQVKAVVQLRDGIEGTAELADELIAYVRDRLAHFKAPKSVDFVDELPRSATGKLVKRTLRESYLEVHR